MTGVNGMGVAAALAGGVLVYSGIRGANLSKTITALATGNKPPGPDASQLLASTAGITDATNPTAGGSGSTPAAAQGGAQGGTAAQNQAIAKLLAQPYGWSAGAQWDALVSLWTSESSWSNTIWNSTAPCDNGAHAYGVPQACGHGVVQSGLPYGTTCPYPAGNAGNPPVCGGTSDAGAQISWGLAYIQQTYPGGPVNVPHGGY